jgi:hypothetical protein
LALATSDPRLIGPIDGHRAWPAAFPAGDRIDRRSYRGPPSRPSQATFDTARTITTVKRAEGCAPKVDTTVRELVDMVGRGELRLPEMQRRYVWRGTRVRDLIDSLYRATPPGPCWCGRRIKMPLPGTSTSNSPRALFKLTSYSSMAGQRVTSPRAVLCDEPIKVRGRKRPIDILFNLEHPEGAPVELTEVDDDSESPLLAVEDSADDEEDDVDDLQQRLRKRIFVVASKALAAIPTWIRVSDVFNPKKSDWTLLKPLGLQSDQPLYEKYSQRLQKLRASQQYQYVMHVLDRKLSYEEVAEIFVRVNSTGRQASEFRPRHGAGDGTLAEFSAPLRGIWGRSR